MKFHVQSRYFQILKKDFSKVFVWLNFHFQKDWTLADLKNKLSQMEIHREYQVFFPLAKICVQNISRVNETLDEGFEKLKENFLLLRTTAGLLGDGLVVETVIQFQITLFWCYIYTSKEVNWTNLQFLCSGL